MKLTTFRLHMEKSKMDAFIVVSTVSKYWLITARYVIVCAGKHRNNTCTGVGSTKARLTATTNGGGRGVFRFLSSNSTMMERSKSTNVVHTVATI